MTTRLTILSLVIFILFFLWLACGIIELYPALAFAGAEVEIIKITQPRVLNDFYQIDGIIATTTRAYNLFVPPIIKRIAEENGVDPDLAINIAKCESNFNPNTVGDNGKAYGIWQIWIRVHDISKECAIDVYCSTEWAIQEFKKGNAYWWSCYNKLN